MNYWKLAITYIDREWLVLVKQVSCSKQNFVALLKRSSFIIPDIAREARHYPPGRCPFLRQTTLQFLFIVSWPGGGMIQLQKPCGLHFTQVSFSLMQSRKGKCSVSQDYLLWYYWQLVAGKKDHEADTENFFPVVMTSLPRDWESELEWASSRGRKCLHSKQRWAATNGKTVRNRHRQSTTNTDTGRQLKTRNQHQPRQRHPPVWRQQKTFRLPTTNKKQLSLKELQPTINRNTRQPPTDNQG